MVNKLVIKRRCRSELSWVERPRIRKSDSLRLKNCFYSKYYHSESLQLSTNQCDTCSKFLRADSLKRHRHVCKGDTISRKQERERDIFDGVASGIESEEGDDIEEQKGTKTDQKS